MKLEFDDKELKTIDNINKDIEEKGPINVPLFMQSEGEYSLKFNCKDIAKANVFINYFMSTASTKKLEEMGIEVLAIEYRNDKNDIIQILEETIEKLRRS